MGRGSRASRKAGRKEGKREEGGRLFEIHKSFPDLLEGATWKRRMRGWKSDCAKREYAREEAA